MGGRASADPALERAIEGALLGETGQERDFRKRIPLVAQQTFGQFLAGRLRQSAET